MRVPFYQLDAFASARFEGNPAAVMLVPAFRLFISRDRKDARKLMFASFLYLPVVQLAYVLDRL